MFPLTTDKDRIALIVAFAALLAQPAVKAQTPSNAVVANIPFAFQVGSSYLPAGTYKLERKRGDMLSIQGDRGSALMVVMLDWTHKPAADSAVVFHHYGDQYFLREIRTAGKEELMWSGETKTERRAKLDEQAANPNSGPREGSKVEIALLAPPR